MTRLPPRSVLTSIDVLFRLLVHPQADQSGLLDHVRRSRVMDWRGGGP
jgi:hypothetical protein